MFAKNEDLHYQFCGQGVKRKILGRGGSLMMVEVTFEKGAVGEIHSHIHEQVSYITEGAFEFNFNGNATLLKKGDSVYIPSGVKHGVTAVEDINIIVDVFTPQREDFIA